MKITDLSKEELEIMPYDDIAFMVLTESNKKMKLTDLFKKVCKLVNSSANENDDQIIAFFELLTGDKRFIMLENGFWDLRSKHSTKIVIDEDDEDEITLEANDDIEESQEEDIFYEGEDTDDTTDDDLKDLIVVDEDDEETSGLV